MSKRNPLLAQIHMAKSQLEMDDDVYQNFLESVTGVRSSGKMTVKQRLEVIKAFRKAGWKPKFKSKKSAPFHDIDNPQMRKAIALWKKLYRDGPVNDGSPEALFKFAQRLSRVDRVEWMDPGDWSKVIEALKDWCRREGIELE